MFFSCSRILKFLVVFSLSFFLVTAPSMSFSNKEGPFEWHPERSLKGHIVIIVSLTDQRLSVYRGGIRIATAPVSTGKPGHKTPTGVFTILQKDAHHHSSIYNNASMPNSERLTWSGVALHAGGLPGYPESHGCVHLSLEFSKLLFSITHIGAAVIIADEASAPSEITHPGPFLSSLAKEEAEDAIAKLKKKKLPHPKLHVWTTTRKKAKPASDKVKATDAPLSSSQPLISILVSSKDRILQAWNGDQKILQASITINNPDKPLGTHLYTLTGIGPDGTQIHWSSIKISKTGIEGEAHPGRVIRRVQMSSDVSGKLVKLLHPGATFMITDRSLANETRSSKGFVIISQK